MYGNVCLTDKCYSFTVFDAYGDSICCGYGNGSYNVYDANKTYASRGFFGSSETTDFCMSDEPGCDQTGQACNDSDGFTIG